MRAHQDCVEHTRTKPSDPRNLVFSIIATAPAIGSLSHVPSVFVAHYALCGMKPLAIHACMHMKDLPTSTLGAPTYQVPLRSGIRRAESPSQFFRRHAVFPISPYETLPDSIHVVHITSTTLVTGPRHSIDTS